VKRPLPVHSAMSFSAWQASRKIGAEPYAPPPLTQTAELARAILDVETIDTVADRGYFKIEETEACEKAGITPPRKKKPASPKRTRQLIMKTSNACCLYRNYGKYWASRAL
jgi:hypothetical protein